MNMNKIHLYILAILATHFCLTYPLLINLLLFITMLPVYVDLLNAHHPAYNPKPAPSHIDVP